MNKLLLTLGFVQLADSYLHMYCGTASCYQLLGVSKSVTNHDLEQAYIKIQQEYRGSTDTLSMPEELKNAYYILSNSDVRIQYDYMLEHPNRVLYNYYQYFKLAVSPNMNFRVLTVFCVILLSVLQYLHRRHSYTTAMRSALKNPKNRSKALHKVQENYLLYEIDKDLSFKEKKDRRKKEEERVLWTIAEKSIQCRRPRFNDTLFIQILFSPYFFFLHVKRAIGHLQFFNEEYEDFSKYRQRCKINNDAIELTSSDTKDVHNNTSAWVMGNSISNDENVDQITY